MIAPLTAKDAKGKKRGARYTKKGWRATPCAAPRSSPLQSCWFEAIPPHMSNLSALSQEDAKMHREAPHRLPHILWAMLLRCMRPLLLQCTIFHHRPAREPRGLREALSEHSLS
mmetsp:Transcript_17689/g.28253  ORF Transcript_17689/g.28253 Transcript_17689/m.28253 type:complete len:114 (-) Transcript_17689:520-861(-)